MSQMTRATRPNRARDQRQRMDAEIVERAVAGRRLVLPEEQRLRVGHEVLVHLDAEWLTSPIVLSSSSASMCRIIGFWM